MMSCSPKQLCATPERHPVLGRCRVSARLSADVVWAATPEPAEGHQGLTERVRQERLLDLGGEPIELSLNTIEIGKKISDDLAARVLGRKNDR